MGLFRTFLNSKGPLYDHFPCGASVLVQACQLTPFVHNTERNIWGCLEFYDMGFVGSIGGAISGGYIQGHKRALAVSLKSQVVYFEFNEGVSQGEPNVKIIRGAGNPRLIGDHFYTVGYFRRVAKRLSPGQWIELTPDPKCDDATDPDFDFLCIDGFNENDIYVCGGRYNLWHHDKRFFTRSVVYLLSYFKSSY